ncbi:hypothetical protein Tco_0105954 [Tanacetum coccineum]
MKAGLATLGLFDEKHLNLSSTDLINSSLTLSSLYFLPFGEVNADDTADKSLSWTSVQPVTQSKAPTAKKPRKKKISSSTKPEALQSSRIDSSSTQATYLQYAEEFVVPVDANKCLDASESTEEQGNQPKTVDAEKVLDQIDVGEKDSGLHSLGDVTFEQLMDEVYHQNKAAQES